MALEIPSRSHLGTRLAPVDARHAPLFCFALLSAASCLASLALACATPFAAFAVIAAAMLPLRPALIVVAGSWLVNQGIGFSALHYPIDAATLAWGIVIGAAALIATLLASLLLQAQQSMRAPLALSLALAAAFGAYELTLFAATPVLGGGASFTTAIVTRIGLSTMAWLVGLVGICDMLRHAARYRKRLAP